MPQQREEAGGVNEEIVGQPLPANATENYVVRLQSLQMDSERENGVHTLRESLAYDDSLRNDRILRVRLQQLSTSRTIAKVSWNKLTEWVVIRPKEMRGLSHTLASLLSDEMRSCHSEVVSKHLSTLST